MTMLTSRIDSIASLLSGCASVSKSDLSDAREMARASRPDSGQSHSTLVDLFLRLATRPNLPSLRALETDILLVAHILYRQHQGLRGTLPRAKEAINHFYAQLACLEVILEGEKSKILSLDLPSR